MVSVGKGSRKGLFFFMFLVRIKAKKEASLSSRGPFCFFSTVKLRIYSVKLRESLTLWGIFCNFWTLKGLGCPQLVRINCFLQLIFNYICQLFFYSFSSINCWIPYWKKRYNLILDCIFFPVRNPTINWKQAGTGPSRRHIQRSKIAKRLPSVKYSFTVLENRNFLKKIFFEKITY